MTLEKQKWYYEEPSFPKWILRRPREWFNPLSWDVNVFPSFGNFFVRWLRNIRVFLSPWYSWRRALIVTFANRNGTKLLADGPSFAYVRTRNGTLNYYRLVCGLYRAKLIKEELFEKASGEKCNAFLAAVFGVVLGRAKPEDYREKKTVLLSGPCFTRAQCQLLLDRIIAATPDCEWFDED